MEFAAMKERSRLRISMRRNLTTKFVFIIILAYVCIQILSQGTKLYICYIHNLIGIGQATITFSCSKSISQLAHFANILSTGIKLHKEGPL